MSDQHHAGCWGGGGRSEVRTPTLNRLASRGVTYPRAYCNNPICGPSRACFLSGQYVYRHGISGNKLSGLHTGPHRNLALTFRENGYETALIGKGHLPKSWLEEGFAYRRYCDLTDAERDDPQTCHYFDHLVRRGLADEYDLGFIPRGCPGSDMEAFVSKIPWEDSVEVWTGDQAVEFLQNRSSHQPFFLQLSFQRPHDPYAPSPECKDYYDPENIELPANAIDYLERRFVGKPAFQRDYAKLPSGSGYPYRPKDKTDLRRQLAAYYSLITTIDQQIGRVMDHLESRGLLANTVILYHADHGDFAGEHGLMLKNFGIYEAIHRIPWIMSYPGCPAGTVDERMVESVDLFPTLCQLAGLEIPAGGDGDSIVGAPKVVEKSIICEWDFLSHPQERVYAVRNERYRLVYFLSEPEDGELYDLNADPGEITNLWTSHPDVRSRMMARLVDYMSGVSRQHSPADDKLFAAQYRNSATTMIHNGGVPYSAISSSKAKP